MSEGDLKIQKLKSKKDSLEKELKDIQQKLSTESRKNRVSRLIKLGELFEKSGFSILELENTSRLLGALMQLKEEWENPATHSKWEQMGKQVLNQQTLRPLAVIFKQDPEDLLKEKLRQLGLRWNKFRQEWQGLANQIEVQEALKNCGAQVECLSE